MYLTARNQSDHLTDVSVLFADPTSRFRLEKLATLFSVDYVEFIGESGHLSEDGKAQTLGCKTDPAPETLESN